MQARFVHLKVLSSPNLEIKKELQYGLFSDTARRKETQVIIRSIPLTQSKYNTKLEQINKTFKIPHINEGKQIWS